MTLDLQPDSPFRIDVLDSSGNKLSGTLGSLRNVLQVNTSNRLSRMGMLDFVLPASDPKALDVDNAVFFDIYTQMEGYIGRYMYRKHTISDENGKALMTVQCWDMLKELELLVAGFARDYNNFNVSSIVFDLTTNASPVWTYSNYDSKATTTFINSTFQGQSHFSGLADVLGRNGIHFRLNDTLRQLEIGEFGDVNTNVRLTNLDSVDSTFDDRQDVAIIKRVGVRYSLDETYNRVIFLGAGQGAAQLTLKDGEVGSTYTVQSRSRLNGVDEYYIEDAASIAANGVREIVVIFDQIRPVSNTVTAKTQAQTDLLRNGEEWLIRHKDRRVTLDNVQAYGLTAELRVGDKINVRYKGENTDGSFYVDIDDDFWVMEKSTTRSAGGNYVTTMKLVNIDREEMNDVDIMAKAVKSIKSKRLWIDPTAFRQSYTYYDTIQAGGTYTEKPARFLLRVDDTVTDVTRVLLRWRTFPLSSNMRINVPGSPDNITGSVGSGSAGSAGHTHLLFNLSAEQIFLVVEDDDYPTDVSISYNGVDISNHVDVSYDLGGSGVWNSGGSPNSALDIIMDITDVFLADAGGIYQDHEIELTCLTRSGNARTPYSFVPSGTPSHEVSHGVVEMTIIVQGVAQAVYKA